MIIRGFKHLKDVQMSYLEHFRFSTSLAKIFFQGSIQAVIHAFLPNFYVTSSQDNTRLLKEKITSVHLKSKL